ncbi:MAG: DNA-binding protein [Thermodesulfobacteriota bacterium]
MRVNTYPVLFLILALTFMGCSKSEEKQKKAPPAEKQIISGTIAPAQTELAGKVVETFDSGGYTYLQLESGDKLIWAAIAQTAMEVGQEVALINGPVMKDFYSRTLERTFPEIIFSAGVKGQASSEAASPHPAQEGEEDADAKFMAALKEGDATPKAPMDPAATTGGSDKAVVNFQEIKVEKVAGGYSIGEIFSQAAQLNGKKVKVRGQVVKATPQIMGTNWLHLQDGSGDPMQNSHDLVVTSGAMAEVGKVIVVEGTMAANKDFGAGYFYKAIIEQAEIKK